jgi:hypothetical protein
MQKNTTLYTSLHNSPYVIAEENKYYSLGEHASITVENNMYSNFFTVNDWIWISKACNGYQIICVCSKFNFPTDGGKCKARSLIINRDGQYIFNMNLKRDNTNKRGIEKKLTKLFGRVWAVHNKLFHYAILSIDTNIPTSINTSIILCKKGQLSRKEWFKNNDDVAKNVLFDCFLRCMGQKQSLQFWKGSSPKYGYTYSNFWRGQITVMYYVSTLMNKDEQRAFIGNCSSVILFTEFNISEFDVTSLDDLGVVPQIFVLVCHINHKYKISVLTRHGTLVNDIHVPSFPVDGEHVVDVILTNIYRVMLYLDKCNSHKKLFNHSREDQINCIIKETGIIKVDGVTSSLVNKFKHPGSESKSPRRPGTDPSARKKRQSRIKSLPSDYQLEPCIIKERLCNSLDTSTQHINVVPTEIEHCDDDIVGPIIYSKPPNICSRSRDSLEPECPGITLYGKLPGRDDRLASLRMNHHHRSLSKSDY